MEKLTPALVLVLYNNRCGVGRCEVHVEKLMKY